MSFISAPIVTKNCRYLIGIFLIIAPLSSCAVPTGNSNDAMAGFFGAPGNFIVFNCEQIGVQVSMLYKRQQELTALMAKASVDADGRIISELAYGQEYSSINYDLNELRKESIAKHCKPLPY
jgi:hypothetical protein